MLRPLANSSIACSTSTCADNTKMPISGNSSRITRAASRPSVVLRRRHPNVGHHQIGRPIADQRQQLRAVAGLADNVKTRPIQQTGQTLTQQHIILGHHYPHCSISTPPSAPGRLLVTTFYLKCSLANVDANHRIGADIAAGR